MMIIEHRNTGTQGSAKTNTLFQNKPSLCNQSHGKILPALTRYITRISFPSPSHSKNSSFFISDEEKLGIISNIIRNGKEEGTTHHTWKPLPTTTYHSNKPTKEKKTNQLNKAKPNISRTKPNQTKQKNKATHSTA